MSPRTPATLSTPLALPCGQLLPNRVAKAAMSEALGAPDRGPTKALSTLYGRWADGGVGLSITGNVMVDPRALGEPGNVVVEDDSQLERLHEWAVAGTRNGTRLWMQLNHPGKQVPRGLNVEAVAPSAVPFDERLSRFFATPRALTPGEIEGLVQRFATAAAVARKAGFDGVQLHGAHGYLISQFLSPRQNQRDDDWGGDARRRMRFVVEVYTAVRRAVGADFPVGIKLNSADFQRGGFTEEESLGVIDTLAGLGLDLVEISGGTYEAPAMSGVRVAASTGSREAYFLDFAAKVRERVATPLLVTGGFRSARAMKEALASGVLDLVGLARPLAIDPDFPRKLLCGEDVVSAVSPRRTGLSLLDSSAMLEVTWYERQLERMGRGLDPRPDENLRWAATKILLSSGFRLWRSRKLRA